MFELRFWGTAFVFSLSGLYCVAAPCEHGATPRLESCGLQDSFFQCAPGILWSSVGSGLVGGEQVQRFKTCLSTDRPIKWYKTGLADHDQTTRALSITHSNSNALNPEQAAPRGNHANHISWSWVIESSSDTSTCGPMRLK
jgi:hypothetical protein